METGQNIIVAFEFGSSAICGIAGYKKPDGKFNILGLEIERKPESIQRGVIYNIDTTTTAIKNIVGRLNSKLKTQITKAYVGLAGQSLHSVENEVDRVLETKVKVTDEIVCNLMDNNLDTLAEENPDWEVFDAVPQEYLIGHSSVINPVGVQAEQIKARYVNVIARKTLRENIKQCMERAGLEIVDTLISPLTLSNFLLSENDKRSGCALVDFGASTTTVSVFIKGMLRHLVVIPIGGDNITIDIVQCKKVFPDVAEGIKRKHGAAYVSTTTDNPQSIDINSDRTIDENDLQTIIGARQEEIIANAWNHIEGFRDNLIEGVVITGGAAQIKNMCEAIRHFTNFERVKAAKSLITLTEVAQGISPPAEVNLDTLVALLLSGEVNCVNGEIMGGSDDDNNDDDEEQNDNGKKGPDDDEQKGKQKGEKEEKKEGGSSISKFKAFFEALIHAVSEEEED